MPEHTISIGNVEITFLFDGRIVFDAGYFFPSVPPEEWEPYRDQITPDGEIPMNLGSFLLRTDAKTVLVDTGLGEGSGGLEDAISGLLLGDMKAKGVGPEEVDMVVITHLHQDHVGWNLARDHDRYRPTFPNARYWIPKADWKVFTRRAGMSLFSHIRHQVIPLEDLGLLELIEGEQALTTELTALPTPGHTPGHTCILVSSQGERGVILGDAAHLPAQLEKTEWSPRVDSDPERSRETRCSLVERLDRDESMIMSGHFPSPSFGRLVRLKGRRYWQAL